MLSSAIPMAQVECFNEAVPGSGRLVLKLECSRASKATYCEAPPGDAELLLNIPFSAAVRLKALCVSGGDGEVGCPASVKLFANSHLDIAECRDAAATQELRLPTPDAAAEVWHNLRVAKFGAVHRLQLYFRGGGEEGEGPAMRVYYVGLKAEVGAPPVGVVHAVYEARAQLADHKQAEGLGAGGSLLH